jgi:hypothetical protein
MRSLITAVFASVYRNSLMKFGTHIKVLGTRQLWTY